MAGKRERGDTTRRRARGAGPRAASSRRARSTERRLLSWLAAATIWGGIGLVALIGWYAYDLPPLSIEPPTRQPSITLIAADGSRFASFGPIYGKAVALGALPSYLPEAVLAVEDRRFYSHPGVDPLGVLRALYVNIEAGRIVQGGSTITQQLAKNLFLSPDRTLKRKVQELLLAFWLEWRFTKDQILTLYLNRVYLGAGTHGVDAASWHYFSKPARELSLYEAAMLAGLLKAPSRFNPATDRGRADQRAALVLAAMTDAGYISAEEAERVARSNTKARGRGGVGRYFADWVWTLVPGYVGNANEDLLVQTTLDLELQQIVSEEFAALLEAKSSEAGVSQGAVVVLDPSGAVRAMLGGSDYERSQFNRATQALRQPGSAFKPFIYLAALEAGYEPDSRMVDAPVRVEDWAPKNYNNRYFGEVTLREAFARSLNSVAVQLSERVGRERVAAGARRLGITSELEVIPSIALGTSEVTLLELSGAYAAFANQGYGVFPYAVEKVTTSSGRLIYLRQGTGPGRVVDPQAAAAMNDLMTATVVWGSGKAAKLERPVAGKTGTSQDFRDAWFLGYTADYVGGVWFGNDDGKPMNAVSGSTLPAVLWGRIMARAHEGLPVRPIGADAQLMASVEEPAVTGESEQSGGFLERLITRLLSGEEESEEAPLRERRLRGSPMPKPERGR